MDKHYILKFDICACKIFYGSLLLQRKGNMSVSKLRKTRVISTMLLRTKDNYFLSILPVFLYKDMKIIFNIL